MTDKAVGLLQQLIKIPSLSRDEAQAADALIQWVERETTDVCRIGNNVIVGLKNVRNDKPVLLLNAHIDTVKPVHGWIRDPFSPDITDSKLYGLGSNDCGGGLVALLMTYLLLKDKPLPYTLLYIASAEEEVSGKNGIERVLNELPVMPACAIVGEPTGMHPAVAERGLMVLDGVVRGKSGHAARNEGVNAIYECLQDIEWLRNYRFAKTSELLGEVKMSVTQISAGTQHNVVPDECRYVVDIRSNELYSNEQLFEEIQTQLAKSELKARSFRLQASYIDMEHPLVKSAVKLGGVPYGSPTLSDCALMPFPTLKLGPGDSARSHTADEYILVSEINEAINFYTSLLTQLRA